MERSEQILEWLTAGKETTGRLIDLKWKIIKDENIYLLENEKVPFTLIMYFVNNKLMEIKLDTSIETATQHSRERLSTYRSLLIMNNQIARVKFMLDGIQENIVARVDLDMQTLTKNELDDALNTLLSSLYMMVKTLNLEEEFNQQIVERMVMLVKDMESEGKSRQEIISFLVNRIGFRDEDARRIVGEFLTGDLKDNERLYG